MRKAKQRRHLLFIPVLNFAARLMGLVGRFALTIYMARFLPLETIGLFGLIAGAAGLMPALSGMGLNFFLSRELVDKNDLDAGVLIRDRLAVTISVMALFCLVGAGIQMAGHFKLPINAPLVAAIIVLDTVAFDLHMSLISLRRSVLANALLSLRSGAWVFPAIGLGVLHPSSRTLDCILYWWLAGLSTYYLVLLVAFRQWPIKDIAAVAVRWSHNFGAMRRGWLIYASDVGLAGSLYLDRYVVAHFLGLSETGIYSLYWTIANGAHMLITAAIVQPSTPALISALKRGEGAWLSVFKQRFIGIALVFLPLSVMMFVSAVYILPHLGVTKLAAQPALFAMMLGGILVRLFADNMNAALYTRHMDFIFSTINLAGLAFAFVAECLLLKWFGILGAGLAMLIIPAFLFAARLVALEKVGIALDWTLLRRKAIVR
jgi:O-antigen/teichoic acid export membrane protein